MSSLSIMIARGLVLLGLALGLAGGPAGAATAEGGYATADLARLADLLGQRGWHTRADGGGNLLITRSGSGPRSPATPAQMPAQSRTRRWRRPPCWRSACPATDGSSGGMPPVP